MAAADPAALPRRLEDRMRRTRPDFRAAARRRLTEERGVSFAVSGLLSPDDPTPATVQVVPIDRLTLHPNIDAAEPDPPAFSALVESVADLGVLAPIVARMTDDGERYEVLDGARRWRAAQAAAHTVVPVILHALDDEAARRFVALARLRRPIPYARLVAGSSAAAADRVPVVISGPTPEPQAAG